MHCFDEEWCEVSGTLRSLAKNILVHRKRPNKSFRIHVSVYIIQDGWSKASDSFKEGITSDFKCPSKYFIDGKFLNKTNEALIFMPETEIFYPAYNDVNEHSGVTFHPIFITKCKNSQKFNSHLFFFSLCYLQVPDFVFLTDSGTVYNSDCLSQLLEYLYKKHTTVIGVTAKQSVMTESDRDQIQENPHWIKKRRRSCCSKFFSYIYWWFSPAPLQGFEFESSFILNTSMFNIIGILPVLPGPCQLLWWSYFQSEDSSNDGILDVYFRHLTLDISKSSIIKANTLLAEDRILSFSMVLRTFNLKTVWVNNATFIYEPMLTWVKLLGQRRRWINGTISTFLYYLMDRQGLDELSMSGLGNNRTITKLWFIQLYQSILQVFSPSFFCIALFEALLKILKQFPYLNTILPTYTIQISNLSIRIPIETLITLSYFGFYVSWVLTSLILGGKCNCCSKSFYNFLMECVYIYFTFINSLVSMSIFYSVFFADTNYGPLFYILVFIWVVPFLITIFFSSMSPISYILYSIPFFINISQYVCFVPAFALARIYDLSWGNRDSNNKVDTRTVVKFVFQTIKINFLVVLLNFIIICGYILAVTIYGHNNYIYVPIFIVLFLSVIIQIFFTFIYLLKIIFKDCCKKRDDDASSMSTGTRSRVSEMI